MSARTACIDELISRLLGSEKCYGWHVYRYRITSVRLLFQSLVESLAIQGRLLLDAGCGSGGFDLTMSRNVYSIGVDIDHISVREAVKRSKDLKMHNSLFLVADIQKLPFQDGVFDVVVSQYVVEHLKNPQNAINESVRVCAKGGKLLVSSPNAHNPLVVVARLFPQVSTKLLQLLKVEFLPVFYRLNSPSALIESLSERGLIIQKLLMIGEPPIPIFYQFPILFLIWIFFNRLTDFGSLKILKEDIILVGSKIR